MLGLLSYTSKIVFFNSIALHSSKARVKFPASPVLFYNIIRKDKLVYSMKTYCNMSKAQLGIGCVYTGTPYPRETSNVFRPLVYDQCAIFLGT